VRAEYNFKRSHHPKKTKIAGSPDKAHISTSYIERLNLTLRIGNLRFTRLTNGYSKKMQKHRLSLAISYFHYNFCRINHSLRVTPAMESGLANHVWEMKEVVALLGDKANNAQDKA
jgi:hypothetical protein